MILLFLHNDHDLGYLDLIDREHHELVNLHQVVIQLIMACILILLGRLCNQIGHDMCHHQYQLLMECLERSIFQDPHLRHRCYRFLEKNLSHIDGMRQSLLGR
jgi:hypothetical protein